MTTFEVLHESALARLDGTIQPGKGKRQELRVLFLMSVICCFFASAGVASANEPWWHVTSGSRPTNLQTGYAQNEVRTVTVNATGGRFALTNKHAHQTGELAFNASAGELQAGLEEAFGVGNVIVTGGPADTATGDLIGPASGMGKLTSGSEKVEEVAEAETRFAVGQAIEGAGIPAGTTILKVEGETLTLSAKATASAEHVVLTGLASNTVTAFTPTGGVLEPHEEVFGNGIPAGTKIEAIDTTAHTLTLSNAATKTLTSEISSALAPYTVQFVKTWARTPVTLVPIGEELTLPGAPGSVSSTRVSEGRPGGEIEAKVYNLGDATADGEASPIVITDTLPAGLTAIAAEAGRPEGTEPNAFSCTIEPGGHVVVCPYHGLLAPYSALEMRVAVEVGAVAGENQVAVSGGEGRFCEALEGARFGTGKFSDNACNTAVEEGGNYERVSTGPIAGATRAKALTLSGAETPFGVEDYEMVDEQEGGQPDLQAGSHPFQTTFSVALNQRPDEYPPTNGEHTEKPAARPAVLVKDLNVGLPPGWIGNPNGFPRCSTVDFLKKIGEDADSCPADTALGAATVQVHEPTFGGTFIAVVPVFNLEPNPGEPARLGFYVPQSGSEVYIDTSVRTGGDYGITSSVHNITQFAGFLSSEVTIWGVPGDPRHDSSRGWSCLQTARNFNLGAAELPPCSPAGQERPPAFVSLPTACTGEKLVSAVSGDSWAEPANEHELGKSEMPPLTGCNKLPFSPSIKVTPDGEAASSSTGIKVDVHVPQEETLNANGLAEADPKSITVALPPGVAVNPSGGDGLEACSEGLVGFGGFKELPSLPETQTATFTEKLPSPLEPGLNFCSNAAKIGTVKIKTPILPNPIEGAVYLATQNQNPFGSLIAIYLVAEDPVSGVLIKLAGKVSLCQGTGETIDGKACEAPGQLITIFENSPQAPFEDAELEFFGGERAPLATPAYCGAYTTTASIAPWSGNAPVNSSSTFNITSGPNHSACPGASLPFSPSLDALTTDPKAGVFSPLSTTINREDGQQNMQSVTLHMPPGLEGLLSGVKLCPEAQANNGTCGPESLIGETTVTAGVGSDPVSVKGGKVYITEKYAGAPFGLSIVNPVKAGPFDLEHDTSNPNQQPPCDCVVVRAKIEVDPQTAALTITTDPSGEHAIPSFIDGIPVQIKKVNVTITRPSFTFNPTSCAAMLLTGAISSAQGATSPVADHFEVTNCAKLKYEPKFTTTTAAKASKVKGASLNFKIAYPKGALGSQAWFNYAKFDIPKQLPARLTTIQKACLAATFETNRGACPAASIIGHAVVHTQVLPVPLEGPVYFVSYGGAKFPDAVVVLKGYGITIELHGHTFINGKTGVTSATFEGLPDVPFESIEVSVPQGPYSEFGANLPAKANDNFCGQKLTMPVRFRASNGLEITGNTPVGVTGCGKALTRAQKLAAALKACHKMKNKHNRQACERAARKQYAAKKASKSRRATKR